MAEDYCGYFVKRKQRVRPLLARLVEKILVNPDRMYNGSPCWDWQGCIDEGGYGRIQAGKRALAHHIAHELFIGPIPHKYEVDHQCRNRRCVSPFHLLAMTKKRNQLLRDEARTHCKYGHPFDEENTYIVKKTNTRGCKICRYARIKLWRERHPEQAREVYRRDKAQYRAKGGAW